MPLLPPTFRSSHLPTRQQSKRQHEVKRRDEQPWRNWYKLKVWADIRRAQLAAEPLCETHLLEYEQIVAADTVHHREPHRGVWERFIDRNILASVCKACHDGEIQRGERAGWTDRGWQVDGQKVPPRVIQPMGMSPSAIPLVMLCGPPGAGKSTYVQAHAKAGDVLIDIDAILAELSGEAIRTQARRDQFLLDAFMERNRRLAALATAKAPLAAWFIVGAPGPSVRQLWANQLKPTQVIVFETPTSVCEARIKGAVDRAETADGMVRGVHAWWDRYERAPCDSQHVETQ